MKLSCEMVFSDTYMCSFFSTQLSKRALLVTTEPTYQLRLDLASNDRADVAEGEEKTVSYNLQCDYANLKNIQSELQKAIDAYSGVHSQRITRYIA